MAALRGADSGIPPSETLDPPLSQDCNRPYITVQSARRKTRYEGETVAHWTLNDIPWDRFEPGKVDPDLLKIIKAASLVEHNGRVYAGYLEHVFSDDEGFKPVIRAWAEEEVQHGLALARWAKLADPDFDFAGAFALFAQKITLPVGVTRSVRGSRSGELIARCMVEVGTSSYYSALAGATREPVLQAICKQIAADELRHYKLFYSNLRRYLAQERIGPLRRLAVALRRLFETEDDELAFAYYAANHRGDGPYDRKRCNAAYVRRAYSYYRPGHVERGMSMVLKAVGLTPNGRLNRVLSRAAAWFLRYRSQRLARAGV
jgi:rubrerythrin